MRNQQWSIPSLCLGYGGLLATAFWTAPAAAMTLDDLPRVHAIAAPAGQFGKLYLATGAGLFVAAGDGSVAKVSKHSDRYLSLAAQAVEPERLLASGASASANLGVVVSRDQGSTWKQLSAGAGGPVGFRTLAISHTDPKILYGQDQILQASSDGGVTWTRVSRVPAHVYNLAVSARDPRTVYAATQTGLLISQDGGVQWRTLHEEDYPATMVHVASDGTVHAFVLGRGLIRARESDFDWKTVSAQFGEQALVSFTVDRGDNHRLYALNQFNRVLTSVDDGATWQALGGDRQPQTEAARRGETLYQTYCQACHGARGVGENHSERSLRDRRYIRAPALDDSTHAWHHSDDNLASTILEGSKRAPRMRAFKDILSRTDALDILAYMKSLWGPRAIACQGAWHMDKECQPPR